MLIHDHDIHKSQQIPVYIIRLKEVNFIKRTSVTHLRNGCLSKRAAERFLSTEFISTVAL